MKKIKQRLATEYLNTDETMQLVLEHVRVLNHLNQLLRSALEDELRSHCMLLDYEEGMLKIAVDTSGSATRLRYQLPDIQKKLCETTAFSELNTILYRIKPELFEQPHSQPHRTPYFSEKIAENLRALANEISDEGLKDALQRLSNYRPSS